MRVESRVARKNRSRVRFRILMAVGAVVAIVVLAILVDSLLYYNKVHAGVSIAGQPVGGMTWEEASAQVGELMDAANKNKITLTHEDKTWTITPTDMGTRADTRSAVEQAMAVSRESNIFTDLGRRLKLYFVQVDVPLVGNIDDRKADQRLVQIAREIDLDPVNAGLSFEDGDIKVIKDRPGRVVEVDKLREEVRELVVARQGGRVAIPVTERKPDITADDTAEAVAQARIMISGPVVLTSGDNRWAVSPAQIGSFMVFTTEDREGVATLVPYLETEKMHSLFEAWAPEVETKPVNASFNSDGEKAWVVPAVLGKKLDPQKTALVVAELAMKESGRTGEVGVATVEPELTTEKAEARGIKHRLSTYTDSYAGSANRQNNVRITTEYASNVMLAPGEVYNFDKQIGPRTAARGYKTAPGIVGPGRLEDVFGGGICEVSTALFNAVFFAGLEVIERKNHSIFIDHYPKGRDATVSAGGPNLRFRNDTKNWIWIRGTSNGITTTFNIYGTNEGRKVTYTTSDFYDIVGRTSVTVSNPNLPAGTRNVLINGQSGRKLKCVRTVTAADGSVIHKDNFISVYPMVPQQIEVGTGAGTTTTTGGSTTTTKPSTTTTTGGTTTTTAPPTTTTTTTPATTGATVQFRGN